MKNSKSTHSIGLGLSFIPLGLAVGITNDKPWIGFFIGLFIAGIIEFIRYKKFNNT